MDIDNFKLINATYGHKVYDLTEEIRVTIASLNHEALQGLPVTVSIGLNSYTPGMGKEELFQGADVALYQAKNSGKNRTALATSIQQAN
jgi:PleD family two-component response regulator